MNELGISDEYSTVIGLLAKMGTDELYKVQQWIGHAIIELEQDDE